MREQTCERLVKGFQQGLIFGNKNRIGRTEAGNVERVIIVSAKTDGRRADRRERGFQAHCFMCVVYFDSFGPYFRRFNRPWQLHACLGMAIDVHEQAGNSWIVRDFVSNNDGKVV